VAESHPIIHPRKSKKKVCAVSLLASDATTAKIAAHTTAQPMLYAVEDLKGYWPSAYLPS
jgi:hypothetical protein